MSGQKFCKDCKYFRTNWFKSLFDNWHYHYECSRIPKFEGITNIITGKTDKGWQFVYDCREERTRLLGCGLVGKYWEEK